MLWRAERFVIWCSLSLRLENHGDEEVCVSLCVVKTTKKNGLFHSSKIKRTVFWKLERPGILTPNKLKN